MLVFLDESGDTGRKTDTGSSQYFIISLVIFNDNDEALACDQRINLLRREINKAPDYEFHFAHNSEKVRLSFLEAINPYNFTYCTVAINKDPNKLFGQGFNVKTSFYKYACNMVFTNALPYLENAKVIIGKSGSSTFQGELRKYLKNRLDNDGTKLRSFKQQESHKNNLLQLADYCAGVCGRKIQNKPDWNKYYKYISAKELNIQIWPR